MRTSLVVFAALAATPLVSAQQRGIFAVFPDEQLLSVSFIDRGAMNTTRAAGEVLNEMPRGLVAGLGMDSTGACNLNDMQVVVQDQNAATVETFGIVARPRAASGTGPDTATPSFRFTGLQTPQQSGAQAWVFTLTFQNPQPVPATDFFHGIVLPAAPTWPATDGLAAQMAHYSQGLLGDHPRATAPRLGWSIDSGGGAPANHDYVWSATVDTRTPTLQMGAVDPANVRTAPLAGQGRTTFGAGGFYPDVAGAARSDGLEVRIYDAGSPGASTAILSSFGLAAAPIPITGIQGRLLLDPASLMAFPGGSIAATAPERAIYPFLSAGSIPSSLSGTGARLICQGVVGDPNTGITLTNAFGIEL